MSAVVAAGVWQGGSQNVTFVWGFTAKRAAVRSGKKFNVFQLPSQHPAYDSAAADDDILDQQKEQRILETSLLDGEAERSQKIKSLFVYINN